MAGTLQDAIDAIDAERAELMVRLDVLAEAAATLRRLLDERTPVTAPKPKAKPVEGEVACPECGTFWMNALALSIHRARTHGANSARPYLAKQPAARAAKVTP